MPKERYLTAAIFLPVLLAGAALARPNPGPRPPGPAAFQERSRDQTVPAIPPSETTQVVLLGTGTPNAEPDRYGSAVAVVVNQTPYLIDAGAGVVHRANQAFLEGVEGMAVKGLSTLFLTHLHTDHTVGLPDLIFTPWVLEREAPLTVVGPSGTVEMTGHLSKAYEQDVQVRLDGAEPANPTGYRVEARDVSPGMVFQDENIRVIAFEVAHGDWTQAFGYRIETPDRVIVISGDTAPTNAVVQNCSGCDILIHEVYSQAGWDRRDPVWQRYHAASHTSGPALGRIAAEAQPKLLVLTHQLLWGATPEELVAEVQCAFSGTIVYGEDLDVF